MSAHYSPGEILLAVMVFSTQARTKRRPVLVIHDSGDDDLLVAPVASHAGRSGHDILLSDWQEACLRLPSVVRLQKLATIEKNNGGAAARESNEHGQGQLKAALQDLSQAIVSAW